MADFEPLFGTTFSRQELLVQHGFFEDKHKDKYEYDDDKKIYVAKDEKKGIDSSHAQEEEIEFSTKVGWVKTGFPKSLKNLRIMWEVADLSLESPYFWLLDFMKDRFSFIEKVEDSFAAAENSAFFGVTQQRLGAQQDKVSQFLATSGKMIKELFQMVRELRILDERLGYYESVVKELEKPLKDRNKLSAIALKGMFVDLVQGGSKSAASVYGMAQQLEFITLPDLFFDAPPMKTQEELEEHMKGLERDFNRNVRRVLGRHLIQFQRWRDSTYKEHVRRKDFQLRYLWQHFEIIKMYLVWVKPYLRHVAKLHMKQKNMQSAEIVSAFEGSMLDVEFLARTPAGKNANSCVLVTFNYRTRPELKVVQEGYQRGPVHIGKLDLTFRAYAWTDKQVEMYKKMKEREVLVLMGDVSQSVHNAMTALGTELTKYLEEAKGQLEKKDNEGKEKKEKKKEKDAPKRTIMQQLFGDFYSSKKKDKPTRKQLREEQEKEEKLKKALESAGGGAMFECWLASYIFKKSHRMTAW